MEIIIAIVLYNALVSAGFCYFIASQKGREPETWGFLGFLFGILALLAIIGLPKIDTQTDLYKKCPYCSENVRNEALICRYCHSKLDKTNNSAQEIATNAGQQEPEPRDGENRGNYRPGISLLKFDHPNDTAHVVSNTLTGSAGSSGLKGGDRLIQIDGIDVQNLSHEEVIEKLGNHLQEQPVDILISRAKGLLSGRNNHSFTVNADVEDS